MDSGGLLLILFNGHCRWSSSDQLILQLLLTLLVTGRRAALGLLGPSLQLTVSLQDRLSPTIVPNRFMMSFALGCLVLL